MERALIFSLWITAAKDPVALRLALEAMASNQTTTMTNGGRVMISASVAGKSFSYSLQPGMSPSTVAQLAYCAWRKVKDFTTSAEVEDFLTLSTGSVSRPFYAQETF